MQISKYLCVGVYSTVTLHRKYPKVCNDVVQNAIIPLSCCGALQPF